MDNSFWIVAIMADDKPVWMVGAFPKREDAKRYIDRWSALIDDLVTDLAKETGGDMDVNILFVNSQSIWKED